MSHTSHTWFRSVLVCAALVAVAGCQSEGSVGSRKSLHYLTAPSVTTNEPFDGVALEPDWTFTDGYAQLYPGDTANHASYSLSNGYFSMSFPDGSEHNQWWGTHAELGRSYEGSGVYETRIDAGLGDDQVGIVFRTSPDTAVYFMLYGHDQLWGYVERFVYHDGAIEKTTFPGGGTSGFDTGYTEPDAGPYYIRVRVREGDHPWERFWSFQMSKDGQSWKTVYAGVLEGSDPAENIGDIQSVGLFMGNQPPAPFEGFEAAFDHFSVYPVDLSVTPGDGEVELSWFPAQGANDYTIHRSTTQGGPYESLGTVTAPGFVDSTANNGTTYYYVVTADYGTPEVGYSLELPATPYQVPVPPASVPLNGLLVSLDASNIQQADGSAVSTWVDASGAGMNAVAAGASRPTYVSAGLRGQPALRFDGVDDYLSLPAGFDDLTNGFTAYVVANPTALQSGFKLLALGNGANLDNVGLGRAGNTGSLDYYTLSSSNQASYFSSSDVLVANQAAAFGVSQAAGAFDALVPSEITVNGVQVGSGDTFVPGFVTRAANYIGKSHWQEGKFEGEIAEVLIWDRELTGQERADVYAYLEGKYSLEQPAPLAPPAQLAANASGQALMLSWNSVGSATGYNIYRSDTQGGPFNLLGSTTQSTFVDSTVSQGATYAYQVTSTANGEESSPSTAIEAVAPTPTLVDIPAEIPANGLALLLDASKLGLGDGEAVSTWLDVSGQGRDATGVAGPLYSADGVNGQPGVLFDGYDDYLSLPAGFADFTAGGSVFVVAQPDSQASSYKMVALGNAGAADGLAFGPTAGGGSIQLVTRNSGGDFSWFYSNSGVAAGLTSVYGWNQAGGAVDASVGATITVNGAAVGSGSVYVPPVTTRSVNYIGKSFWAEANFKGLIAEVIVYDRQLSSAESSAVQAYLDAKYGLSAPQAPTTPTGLQVTSGAGVVNLAWDESPSADQYNVYRATSSDGPFTQIGTTTTASFADTTATAGTDYFYAVTTVIGGQESGVSGSAAGTAEPPPSTSTAPDAIPAAGLSLFLDASALTLAEGDPVDTWLDGSGLGLDATASSPPSYSVDGMNGEPAVVFDGVDDFLELPSGFENFTGGLTLFVVAKPTALQPGFKMVALGNGPGIDDIVLGQGSSAGSVQYFTNNSSQAFGWFETAGDTMQVDAPSVFEVRQEGGQANASVSATVSVDGEPISSGSVFVPPVTTRNVNYIGKSFWSEGAFQGAISEIILYTRELSASEVDDVHTYLESKYGTLAAEPLQAPSGLTTSATQTSIDLAWDAVPGASEYVVYRADAETGPFSELVATADPSYSDTTAVADTTHYYYVTSLTSQQESAPSVVVSDALQPAPEPVSLPAELPAEGLSLFLDASSLGAADGETLTGWNDLSGAGMDAAVGGNPVYEASGIGGQPSVVFDGVDDYLQLPAGFSDFTGGMSVFLVAQPTALQSGFKLLALGNGPGVQDIGFGRHGTTNDLQLFTNDISGNWGWFQTSGGLSAGSASVFAAHQAAGAENTLVNASVVVDGTQVGSGSVYVPPVLTRSVNYVGKSFWDEGIFEGRIAEVIVYARELSPTEQAGVQAYLAGKYGL